MRKLTISTILFTSVLSLSAWAGFTQPQPVTIEINEDGSGRAAGDLLTARDSRNKFEFIGCGMRYIQVGPVDELGEAPVINIGFCQAAIEEDESVVCFTRNEKLIDGMRMTSDSNYYEFFWTTNEAGGLECTRIYSSVQSFYLTKTKANKAED